MATTENTIHKQLAAYICAIAMFAAAVLAFFFLSSMVAIDHKSEARDTAFIRKGLAEQMNLVSKEQLNLTLWDEAANRAAANDMDWIAENIGIYMNAFYRHDEVYVLNPKGLPVYAMQFGKTVETTAAAALMGSTDMIDDVRKQLEVARDRSTVGITDVGYVEGRPAIVSVKPIVPFTKDVVVPKGQESIHVSVRFIDGELMNEIGRQYLVTNVKYVASEPTDFWNAGIEIRNSHGQGKGWISWELRRPGLQMVKDTLPALGLVALVMVGLMRFLYGQLRRSTTRLQASEAQAQHQAYHDSLTGLPNRAMFNRELDEAIASHRRDGTDYGLLCLDLDRFKIVNDTLGHSAGDEVIKLFAQRLRAEIDSRDLIARLSGDEFAVVVTDPRSIRDLEALARRIIEAASRPCQVAGTEVSIGVSIGAVVVSDHSVERPEVLRRADLALYESKGRGRGRCSMFDAELDSVVQNKRIMEGELREALAVDDQLRLVYQPMFGRDAWTPVGAEALIRWIHPVKGTMSPASFIPIAEERGLISQIGMWTLREACRTLARIDLPWIAVNVSPVQLRTAGFAEEVLAVLAEYRVAARRIQIEITEGVLLEKSSTVEDEIRKLKTAGIRIALDDFGTGYSSIQYLHTYPVDKIKIDQSFVQQLGVSNTSTCIVRAMIDLAKAMEMTVTSEGVENEMQRNMLVEMGCTEMQGYLLSTPIEQKDLAVLCRTRLKGGKTIRKVA